jgi:RHS repeat-associated protein
VSAVGRSRGVDRRRAADHHRGVGHGASTVSSLNSDGTVVAFVSAATEFASGDANNATDVFARASLGDTSTYTYDRLSRLTGSVEPIVGATTYAYDPVGNRSSRTRGTTVTSTYDGADRLTAIEATPVTTDAAGQVVARGSDAFGYDGYGRLVSAHVGSVTETYTYDGDGNRVSRTSGAATIPYVIDTARELPVILADGTRKYVWGQGLLYGTTGSTVEVVHADRLGSVRSLTDATGTVTATYRTDAWGVPTTVTGSSTQPFGFTGEPVDATDLVYLRARMYDPATGRFMSRDAWPGSPSVPVSLNRCLYAGADPTTWTDPSGHAAPWGPWEPWPPAKSQVLKGTYNVGECLAGVLGFTALADAGLAPMIAGAVLGFGSFTLAGITFGAGAPATGVGLAAALIVEASGFAIEGAAFALIYKTCVSQ